MAAAFVAVIAMVIIFTVFTFLTSTEMVGRGRKAVARLLRRMPLHSLKIIIVAWQIVTQVRGDTKSIGLVLHFV